MKGARRNEKTRVWHGIKEEGKTRKWGEREEEKIGSEVEGERTD